MNELEEMVEFRMLFNKFNKYSKFNAVILHLKYSLILLILLCIKLICYRKNLDKYNLEK